MAKVELRGISKVFEGNVRVVDNIHIVVEDREFVVLLGPSGCGKSTTLRMIAGLEEISDGELYIDGELMNDVPPKNRNIAMVFQNYALYPHMSVYENMAFALKMRNVEKSEIHRQVHEAARILDIVKLLERKPKALSGGQKQRVALGRAIVRNPKVFLFDEPLSNLDAKLRLQMRTELTELQQRLNATIIYVTHDQAEAMSMASKIIVMKDGKIQQTGSPLDLYNNPVNKFVAGFIGSPPMNFLVVKVLDEGSLLLDEGTLKLRPSGAHIENLKKYIGKELYLGIRPEDLSYSENSEAENNIPVKITVVEPLGADIYLWMFAAAQPMAIRTGPQREFKAGDTANFIPRMEKARYFDKETEFSILVG
jgi:multiple sugar transport system ATP-binding protein